jgi:hypothetical protein
VATTPLIIVTNPMVLASTVASVRATAWSMETLSARTSATTWGTRSEATKDYASALEDAVCEVRNDVGSDDGFGEGAVRGSDVGNDVESDVDNNIKFFVSAVFGSYVLRSDAGINVG